MLGERAARGMNLPEFDTPRFQQSISEIRTLTLEEPGIFSRG